MKLPPVGGVDVLKSFSSREQPISRVGRVGRVGRVMQESLVLLVLHVLQPFKVVFYRPGNSVLL